MILFSFVAVCDKNTWLEQHYPVYYELYIYMFHNLPAMA